MDKKLDFLKKFKKDMEKVEGISSSSEPPRYWISTGNYVLNKIISDSFYNGVPQGRLLGLSGPSGSGKSFLIGNIIKNAQKEGAICLVIDSENALDDVYMNKIGVDTESDFYDYKSISTIPQLTQVVSSFIKEYKAQFGTDPDAPRVLIGMDSLDMLMTETEDEQYDKGIMKGDQGQRNKQFKKILRTFVQDIKGTNISMVITSQVYQNQDLLNGEGLWKISDAVKFALSQIVLLTKLKLKETGKSEVQGIRMKCQGYKTRFSKPDQTVTIEVPYETGMNPLSGLLEVAISMGIVEKAGSRYKLAGDDKTWYSKDIGDYADEILKQAESARDKLLKVSAMHEDDEEIGADEVETSTDTKQRRLKTHRGK